MNEPYTNSVKETNLKDRLVYCEKCDYKALTRLPNPKCGMCNSNLITVINDMAIRTNQST